ncbi:MAG: asparagine synthase (glutamine-hydrolyzing) [Candidatus Calescibacterium sp.]|nr:asparagine synthase (glutamine-hydrolyzing) [Candidatus Calescibacterium sp.]
MCRIVGFWDRGWKEDYSLESVITDMRDSMAYGGPDDAGMFIDKSTALALGHRRLAILDLSSAGHQPMEFSGLVITYNGEVYNFREISKELEKEGYKFFSGSDTEVILKAFHRWGLSAVKKFRGMFAFCIWDKTEKRLILCRDRIGVKPLYYYHNDGLFMFASELKAFHYHPKFRKTLSFEGLALFLQYGYITSPFSIFENVYKLEPGYFLIVEANGELKKLPYWSINDYFEAERIKGPEEELAEELENLLNESFKLRMVSDVPVGLFLSGGIDSSTVCALLQRDSTKPLKTFTIGFYEKDFNEAEYAKKVAEYLGTDHTELYCTPKEALEVIPKWAQIYDEPFGDSSGIPTYLVSKLAKSKVKVSLSADGGDEQFCGYTRYWTVGDLSNKLKKIPFLRLWSKSLSLISPEVAFNLYKIFKPLLPKWTNFRDKYIKLRNILNANTIGMQYDISNKIFLPDVLLRLFLADYSIPDHSFKMSLNGAKYEAFTFMMIYDLKTYLPDDILVKVDRATMSLALEGREPLLDHKIIEFTSRLPFDMKYRNAISKFLLRKILYKYVPKELVERPKMGFGVPIYEWFKVELKELYKAYLDPERIKKEGLFNHEVVEELLKGYFQDKGVNHNKLWLLFVFELWKERWLGS